LALASVRREASVLLFSGLNPESARGSHLTPIKDIGLAIAEFTASFHLRNGRMPSVGVFPHAARTIVGG
jgi:hypothetical protein